MVQRAVGDQPAGPNNGGAACEGRIVQRAAVDYTAVPQPGSTAVEGTMVKVTSIT